MILEWRIASEVGIIMDYINCICEVKNMKFTLSRIFIKMWLSTLKEGEVCPSKPLYGCMYVPNGIYITVDHKHSNDD